MYILETLIYFYCSVCVRARVCLIPDTTWKHVAGVDKLSSSSSEYLTDTLDSLRDYLLFFCSCDSVEKLKTKLPTYEHELRDNGKFKDFYQFTFNYARNPGQKGLDLDMAIAYWNIVLQGRFKLLPLWCRFLQVGPPLFFLLLLSSNVS